MQWPWGHKGIETDGESERKWARGRGSRGGGEREGRRQVGGEGGRKSEGQHQKMAAHTDNSLLLSISCSHLPSLWGPRQVWQRQGRGLNVCMPGVWLWPTPTSQP